MAAPNSVDQLRSILKDGPAVSSKYRVIIPNVPNSLYGDPRNINILCSSASIPGRGITPTEVRTSMQQRAVASAFVKEDVQFTFNMTNNLEAWRLINDWYRTIIFNIEGSAGNFLLGYKDDYSTQVTIEHLDQQGNPTIKTKLKGAFPVLLSGIELDNDPAGGISTCTCTFTYDNWEVDYPNRRQARIDQIQPPVPAPPPPSATPDDVIIEPDEENEIDALIETPEEFEDVDLVPIFDDDGSVIGWGVLKDTVDGVVDMAEEGLGFVTDFIDFFVEKQETVLGFARERIDFFQDIIDQGGNETWSLVRSRAELESNRLIEQSASALLSAGQSALGFFALGSEENEENGTFVPPEDFTFEFEPDPDAPLLPWQIDPDNDSNTNILIINGSEDDEEE